MLAGDKNLSEHKEVLDAHAGNYNIAIVVSKYHEDINQSALRTACIDTLIKYGVKEKNITVQPVPRSASELPLASPKWASLAKANADVVNLSWLRNKGRYRPRCVHQPGGC